MSRSVPEWIGADDNAKIPARVKLRILDKQRPAPGEPPICACGCGQSIKDGDGVDFDHAVPLADGGAHAEGNLRALLRKHHKLKTAREALARAETRGSQRRAYGLKKNGNPLPGSRQSGWKHKMSGEWVRRDE